MVYLVGAGPGDAGLLTLRGAQVLRIADVVIYDSLANSELLKLCPPTAKLVFVGKRAGHHTKTQDEINTILVDEAFAEKSPGIAVPGLKGTGRVVVRLKGGDPYVFGRGGEEGEHLRKHGIPFEVIPGVTAGIAAPAYAGIPVTHRNFASTVTLVTGHEETRVNFEALAKLGRGGGTIVFYMGVKGSAGNMEKLMAGGMDATIPVAVIQWGTRTLQRTVVGTAATIAELVRAAGIATPAITVVGKVVALRETLNWFERQPLFGKCVLVTRTRQQASELASQLAELGAQVLEAATIEIVPPTEEEWEEIDKQLMHLPAYDWVVFTSVNGVQATWKRLRHLGFDARHFGASNVAAVGKATADALEQIGISPDVMPEKFAGKELAEAIKGHIGDDEMQGKRFLMLRADIARPALREELLKLGAMVDDVAVYQTRRPEQLADEVIAAIDKEELDWVTFTSGSTAMNLWELLLPEQRTKIAAMRRASIGPMTTESLEKLGWKPTVEAKHANIKSMVDAILEMERSPKGDR
ncbi:MAG: uroporphyrinogen-III C-methyltransferase [Phycisphaerales bacterium]|nr:uroporphyrinogen-III C-methyltransferase [Phycisphaerales bacterium]